MNEFWARLNPGERRVAVIGTSLLFLVINYVFVWPHFFDWGKLQIELQTATRTVETRRALIAQTRLLEEQERKLKDEGAEVPQEDQAFQFVRTIQTQAAQTGVRISNLGNTRTGAGTNQFFMEQSQTITVQSDEKQLVDFLYGLGAGTSLVRVRALSVSPDPPHQTLNSQITLVASYQKTPKAAPPAVRPAPATKPAPSVKPAAPAANPSAPPARPSTAPARPPGPTPPSPTPKKP